MKYLLVLDCILAAAGAAMAINLSVVGFILYLYIDEAPRYADEYVLVLFSAGFFAVLFLCAGLAAWALWRKKLWHWGAQVMTVVTVAMTAQFVIDKLG